MNIKNIIAVLVLFIGAGVFPLLITDNYIVSTAVFIGLWSMMTIGLKLLMGYAGQISLGHAAFHGIGAYTSALLTTNLNISPWLAMVLAVLLSGVIAFAMGLPILRLSGHYLAMATLAFGMIVYIFFEAAIDLTGGPSGIGGIPSLAIGSWVIDSDREFFYLVWGCMLVTLVLALNIVNSRVGRALRSIHGSPLAAGAMGVNISWYKLQMFVLSACLASFAGSLYAHYLTFIGPSSFGFKHSVTMVTMVAVGGMSSLWGALAGTVLLRLLPEVLGVFDDYYLLIYGGIMIVIMLFIPEGILLGLERVIMKIAGVFEKKKEGWL